VIFARVKGQKMLNDFDLEGKTALVTGASSGIGKEIALVLAEAGADLAIAARRLDRIEQTADELRAFGRRAVPIQTDVSDSQQVDDMVAQATESLGRIDILVNNAGISAGGPLVPLPGDDDTSETSERMDDTTWQSVIDTNLNSAMYVCRAIAPQMLERRSGKIINIASTNATLAYPNGSAYQVSKAGMKMLTKVLANEWGQFNINVNAIGPGWFVTEMTEDGLNIPGVYQEAVSNIPLGRLTNLLDLGLLAVYLASPASDWMTGQIIYLDGGETALYS
jgi:NAD(P)-dependent dehydrogenase (short-subunit alcohol dehydrogenase family)